MTVQSGIRSIPLPSGWKSQLQSAMVQIIALAHRAIVQGRGGAASGRGAERRLRIEIDRLGQEVALLREEL